MNYIKIEYSFMNSKAKISINGEKISSYSDMTSLMNRPFHEIENSILSVLDKEIFEDYEIDLHGMVYQYEVLKYYQKKSEYCKNISFTEIELSEEKKWYDSYILKLTEKYRLQMSFSKQIKLFTLSEEALLTADNEISICGQEEADIGICLSQEEAQRVPMDYAAVLCDKYDFDVANGKKIFYLQKKGLKVFMDYFREYCLRMPQFEKIIENLKYMRLEERDKIGLNACLTGNPSFYLGEVPEVMEDGKEVTIQFESFPSDAFFIRSKDEEVLNLQNHVITAKGNKTGIIEIVDLDGVVADSKVVTVIQHNYVKEIRIISEFSFLNVNDRSRIEIVAIPADAEDANDLKWEVENQSIVHVRENGEIIALAEGRTKLRISGINVVKELDIEVKPMVKELRFRDSLIRMRPGETVVVECDVIPQNASCDNLKWSFDNEVIASFSPSYDGRKCKLQAKREHSGKGNLKCMDQKRQVSAVCNIEVVKLKTAGGLAGFAIASLVLGFLCMPVFTPLSIILSIIGLASSEADGEKKTFKTCLIVSLIEVVIILLIVLLEEFC